MLPSVIVSEVAWSVGWYLLLPSFQTNTCPSDGVPPTLLRPSISWLAIPETVPVTLPVRLPVNVPVIVLFVKV